MMEKLLPVVTFLVLVLAAIFDLHSRKIPLWLTVTGFFSVLVTFLLTRTSADWGDYFFSFGLGGILFFLGWLLKLWGGGDAKLLMVTFLSVPVSDFVSALGWIFVAGGLQAVGFMGYYYWFKQGQTITHLPYALALAIGYLGWCSGWYVR